MMGASVPPGRPARALLLRGRGCSIPQHSRGQLRCGRGCPIQSPRRRLLLWVRGYPMPVTLPGLVAVGVDVPAILVRQRNKTIERRIVRNKARMFRGRNSRIRQTHGKNVRIGHE